MKLATLKRKRETSTIVTLSKRDLIELVADLVAQLQRAENGQPIGGSSGYRLPKKGRPHRLYFFLDTDAPSEVVRSFDMLSLEENLALKKKKVRGS